MASFFVSNYKLKMLYDYEILGQFSDGLWENDDLTIWKYLPRHADVVAKSISHGVVISESESVHYHISQVPKLANEHLLESVGNRMLLLVKIGNAIDNYILPKLRNEELEVLSELVDSIYDEEISKSNLETVIQDHISSYMRFKHTKEKGRILEHLYKSVGTETLYEIFNSNDISMKDVIKNLNKLEDLLEDVTVYENDLCEARS